MELQLRGVPRGIQQEGAAVLDLVDHIILGDIGLRMAGQEVGGLDQIGGADGALGEPQVALGDAVGLLGVILKVSLGIHTGVVADDLGGVLVRANGTVRAKTPEFAGHSVGRLGDQRLMDVQRQMGHIVHEADGEHLLGVLVLHVVIDGLDLGGRHIPAGNTVAAAIDGGGVSLTLQSRAGIQINGAADSAGLLGAVHGGDLLHRLGQGVQEILDVKGAEQVDLQQANLLALCDEVIDDLLGALAGRAHHHDDPLGILSAIVVEDVVVAAGDLVDPLHVALYDVGDRIVSGVVGFLALEIHVRALHGGTVDRVLGVHGNVVELSHGVLIQQLGGLVQIQHLDLLDLMAGAEAVMEVQEGHAGLDGGQMGHGSQIHNLLHAGGGHHGNAGGAAGHHVLMIAEDVVGLLCHGPGRHMEHGGHPVTGHNVHIGDHQQQALRGGEGGRHSAGLRNAVERAGGAALGLHLHQSYGLTEHVLTAGRRPLVHLLTHGGGGGDGENSRYISEMIGNIGAGLIAVHCFHDFLLRHRSDILLNVLSYIYQLQLRITF